MPRRPKYDLAEVEDLTPPEAPEPPADAAPGADRSGGTSARGLGRRLGISVPGAIAGALLVCTLAFGASIGAGQGFDGRDASDRGSTTDCVGAGCVEGLGVVIAGNDDETPPPATEPGHEGGSGDATEPGADAGAGHDGDRAEPTPDGATEPATEPTTEPEPDKTPKPDPKPEPKPDPKPDPKPEPKPTERPPLGLELSIREEAVLIDWTSCEVDGAQAYKVVRSSDETVRWPLGDGDTLVAVVEMGGATKAWDEHAPAGKKVWYRVFCVRHTDAGYQVLRSSEARAIRTPEKPEPTPTPTPAPEHLSLEAGVDGDHVVLHWEACGGETFSHYRILRKTTGDATLLTEIANAGTTSYVDEGVEPGVEYHYLVQCKGHTGDGYFLLGTTEWVAATVE